MIHFETAIDQAVQRLDPMETARSITLASEQRRLFKIASNVSSVLGRLTSKDRWPLIERAVIDRASAEAELGRSEFTSKDLYTRTESGWVLCERVEEGGAHRAEFQGQPISIRLDPKLKGLLLDQYGRVFSYSGDITMDYPKRSGKDAWGEFRNDIYAEGFDRPRGTSHIEAHIIGEVAEITAPNNDGTDVYDYDRRLHAFSGSLGFDDLLAGIVVRFDLDPEEVGFISPAQAS